MTQEQLEILQKRAREADFKRINSEDAINFFKEFIYDNIRNYRPDDSSTMFDVACFIVLELAEYGNEI